MKRLLVCLALLSLLLSACGEAVPAATVSTEAPAPALVGVWVNAGQYSEGRDFVETLTLREDGTVTVDLQYQGKPYASLEGRWTARGDSLSVDFTDPNTKDRVYRYAVTGTTLTLSGSGKDAIFQRQH